MVSSRRLECTGSLEIKNIIEVLDDHVGISVIAKNKALRPVRLTGRARITDVCSRALCG